MCRTGKADGSGRNAVSLGDPVEPDGDASAPPTRAAITASGRRSPPFDSLCSIAPCREEGSPLAGLRHYFFFNAFRIASLTPPTAF